MIVITIHQFEQRKSSLPARKGKRQKIKGKKWPRLPFVLLPFYFFPFT